MIARVREIDIACNRTHGGGRRPGPQPALDLDALEIWMRRQLAARKAYQERLNFCDSHDRNEAAWDQYEGQS